MRQEIPLKHLVVSGEGAAQLLCGYDTPAHAHGRRGGRSAPRLERHVLLPQDPLVPVAEHQERGVAGAVLLRSRRTPAVSVNGTAV